MLLSCFFSHLIAVNPPHRINICIDQLKERASNNDWKIHITDLGGFNHTNSRAFLPFFVADKPKKYSPLGALGAKAIEAAIMAKRVTIWKVFMVDIRCVRVV